MTLGIDISTPGAMDLDPYFALASEGEQLVQALARRIVTPTGALRDDPSYGYDVRAHLNDAAPQPRLVAAAVRAQWLADERVEDCDVRVTFADDTLTIQGAALTSAGTFRFVLAVSAVTIDLLRFEAA